MKEPISIQPIDLEIILKRYYKDKFREECKKQIELIISKSVPKLKLNLNGNGLSDFEIYQDAERENEINFWIDIIKGYTKNQYPEITFVTE